MNRVIMIGRLTADVELRYTASGTAVAQFTLAVNRRKKEDGADFINIVVWQKLGELCAQYLRKGRQCAVDGRLQIRTYENKEGQKVRVAEVVAENVQFLERADSGGQQGNQQNQGAGNGGGYSGQGGNNGQGTNQGGRKNDPFGDDDPFSDKNKPIDISDDDLPF